MPSDLEQDRNNYSNILKAISLFGGVKVIQIIFNILRSKVIAILIGPSGMGIIGLFQSSIEVVNQVTGCGLQTTAVREISKSLKNDNQESISIIATTLRYLVWISGFIGMLVLIVFSNQLSMFAFGNVDHSNEFKILSIILLLTQLSVGQIALLQGTFRYREMAKASVFGAGVSLVVVCPLFYYWGEESIVPSLIITAFITLFFSWFYSKKYKNRKINMTLRSFLSNSKDMITMGVALAIGTSLSTASGYFMNIFLSLSGSEVVVGLYQAACQVANSYLLLVLSAMATDYIPRLSALNGDNLAQIEAINKQAILVSILLAPLLAILMVFSKEVILLLYSTKFLLVSPLLTILMFGMIFRAVSWCMAYSLIARGDSKRFLLCEATTSLTSLLFKIVGYLIGGFVGMGVGFVINYFFYSLLLYYLSKKAFNFCFEIETIKVICKNQVLLTICLVVCYIPSMELLKYVFGALIIAVSAYSSYMELSQRMNLNRIIKAKFHK